MPLAPLVVTFRSPIAPAAPARNDDFSIPVPKPARDWLRLRTRTSPIVPVLSKLPRPSYTAVFAVKVEPKIALPPSTVWTST